MLGSAGFLDETHAAMDLDAHGRDFDPDIRGPGLGNRGQQFLTALGDGALFLVLGVFGQVSGNSRRETNGPGRRDLGAHHGQRSLDIGMFDDGMRPRTISLDGRALLAIPGIDQRLLIGPLGNPHALNADIEAG